MNCELKNLRAKIIGFAEKPLFLQKNYEL